MSNKYLMFLTIIVIAFTLGTLISVSTSVYGTTNGNIRFFTENNFTLDYDTSEGDIFPFSEQMMYDSASNNLTSIHSSSGNVSSNTIHLTAEEKNDLIETIANTDYGSAFFSTHCSFADCGLAHLTINVPTQNFTNSFSWSGQSAKSLEGLMAVQERLLSLSSNSTK